MAAFAFGALHDTRIRGCERRVARSNPGDRPGGSVDSLIRDSRLGQEALRDIAGRRIEFVLADGIELERTLGRIGDHGHGRGGLRGEQGGVRIVSQSVKQGRIREHREQAPREDDRLAADSIGHPAEQNECRRGECKGDRGQNVGRGAVDTQHALQEKQRVELSRVPDHRLPHDRAEQCDQNDLQIAPPAESFRERGFGGRARLLHVDENRAFVELHANPERDDQQQQGDQERNAPSPALECVFPDCRPRTDYDQQRGEQSERGGGLNPTRVQAALSLRRMLGHVSRGAAVFSAQSQALQQPQRHERDRSRHAHRGIARQKPHEESRPRRP